MYFELQFYQVKSSKWSRISQKKFKSFRIFEVINKPNKPSLTQFACSFLVCEYYGHVECQDFAIADCKENATYVPGKDLLSVKHIHHWREGNLPQSSKCVYCKKTCWSSECLTGKFSLLDF